MDSASSYAVEDDDEMKVLEGLIDAFSSVCSLEEIASAYCRAGKDVNKAGEILYVLHENKSNGISHAYTSEMDFLHKDNSENSIPSFSDPKGSKSKKLSASVGTVSSVLGKTYARNCTNLSESSRTTKVLKPVVKELSTEERNLEPAVLDFKPGKESVNNHDIEEFLFTMLGDEFNLSLDVIRETLGNCGNDAKKSMEELLALSEKSIDKGKGIDYDIIEKSAEKCQKMETYPSEENHSARVLNTMERNLTKSSWREKERSNLPNEVIAALFNDPERYEGEPKRRYLEWGLNRTRVVGQKVVNKPVDDFAIVPRADTAKTRPDFKDVLDEEDKYHSLRRAAKQHWENMKVYYEAAIDAFTSGNRAQAKYLLEQGQYYNQMAREADEKSAGAIIETRNNGSQGELTLDLHAQRLKEALYLLKFHLRQLAGIPTFKHLKVIMDTNAEDIKKGKRRRLVTKLLEKKSIKWTEEDGNPGTIFIQLDVLDPNKVHFGEDSE